MQNKQHFAENLGAVHPPPDIQSSEEKRKTNREKSTIFTFHNTTEEVAISGFKIS
jgi:hypothetical protein